MELPKIRAACADDIPEMVRIQKESLADTYGHFLDADSLEPWLHGEIIEQYVAEKWPQTLVAESLGEVVGIATIGVVFRVDDVEVVADCRLARHAAFSSGGARFYSKSEGAGSRSPRARSGCRRAGGWREPAPGWMMAPR